MSELSEYDYSLPKHLIAQQPVPHRPDARLMVVDRRQQALHHAHVRDLPEWLQTDDCLVLNDSKVVPARLVGYRQATGGRWEGLFLKADQSGNWQLLGKARGKLTPGERIVLLDRNSQEDVCLRLLTRLEGGTWAARIESPEDTWSVLDRVGRVPLPHYIRKGQMVADDLRNYQTVYARQPGSVAAPTAGLHFSESLLRQVQQQGVDICRVTLHVGIGTFRPVTARTLEQHRMHQEWGEIREAAVEQLQAARQRGGRVVAVGTTSVRVLESAAASGQLRPWSGETDLFIRPPYTFRAIDALLTNFHLPKSTLLVLVRTFGGDALIRRAYEEAVREEYRFFSYGDAMLIL